MTEPVRFDIPDCPREQVEGLCRELGVSGTLAQTLVRRGLEGGVAARAFLDASEEHDPLALAGASAGASLLLGHARAGHLITVHGDYDVDGICATAVLVRALRSVGADVDWYLPDRACDGYGLAQSTVERLAARGTRLLVSVDCGITAVGEVARARALGMEVIISDHHAARADGQLPEAIVVHPALGEYPFPQLCGTGVAYKLAQALAALAGGRGPERDLDLVALATIADVVPLVGENRSLVRRGLRALAATAKPGLRALMKVARVDPGRVDERAVGFSLAPRLNAAGRLYRADAGLELILTEDPVRAAQIAEELDRVNQERRRTELGIRIEAEAQIAALAGAEGAGGVERASYVLASENWHPGVIGIVAARLAEAHSRPVVMLALEGASGRGSGRSVEGFDLLGALRSCEAALLRYGGHRAAAGLELERARLEEFAEAFETHARDVLERLDMTPRERVDAVVEDEELGMELAEELALVGPFGMGNPPVSLLLREARFCDTRPMGEGKHLRFTVQSRGVRARGVAFGTGSKLRLGEDGTADATFTLEVNEFRGVSEPRLVLRRLRACEQRAPALEKNAARPLAEPARIDASEPSRSGETPSGELVLF